VPNSDEPKVVELTLRSSSLYRGEFRAIEDRSERPSRRWGGQQIKDRLQPFLYWFLRNAPGAIALLPFHAMVAVARGFYGYRRNLLRQACEDICRIAGQSGYRHEPKALYARFLSNVIAAARAYRLLIRGGSGQVMERVDTSDMQRVLGEEPLTCGQAFVMFAPHNLAAVYSAVALTRLIPLLIVSRNSKTIRRTKLALDVFERIGARVLMVRGGNPFEISRAMFSALDDGQVLAATVDNVDPGFGVKASIFGIDVEFAPWAARIACKRKTPVVPAFFHSQDDKVRVAMGEPLLTADPAQAIQHYASFFEQRILQDPASWAYLADRKWCRVLRQAAAGIDLQNSGTEAIT
jgi:lauroyl/myristoyl acyltransferase